MSQIEKGMLVGHKTFGIGQILEVSTDRTRIDFAGRHILLEHPHALQEGIITLVRQPEPLRKPKWTGPVVFMNVAWMKWYRGITDDPPISSHIYIEEYGDGGEVYNFLPIELKDSEDENLKVLLGRVETKTGRSGYKNQLRLENIRGGNASPRDLELEDVLVIWCAVSPDGGTRVVGWYHHARVFRYYESIICEDVDGTVEAASEFNVMCLEKDGVLLPVHERYDAKWRVPRHNNRNPVAYGFGQSDVWYAKEEAAEDFVARLIQSIEDYESGK